MAYQFYLAGVLLPVTPGKLKVKINGQNKTMNLIDGSEINILNPAGLSEFSFEAMLPQVQYPFAEYEDDFEPPEYFLNHLEGLKTSQKPFDFLIIRESPSGDSFFDTNISVSLEDYTIEEDADDGFDVTVSVSLKQYRHYGTKVVVLQKTETEEAETAEVAVEETRETSTAPQSETYTVQKGDCLWNIAKKKLGKGSRWEEIYQMNMDKIQNPNLIYPGQVFTLPTA